MTKTLLRAGSLACALLTTSALTAPAFGQAETPSVFHSIDPNGVDLVDGRFNFNFVEGSVGSGDSELSLVRIYGASGLTTNMDNFLRRFDGADGGYTVSVVLVDNGNAMSFTGPYNATSWTSDQQDGATLVKLSATSYRYTAADGTVINYGVVSGWTKGACTSSQPYHCRLLALDKTRPNGAQTTYSYGVSNGHYFTDSIQNSYGYKIGFRHSFDLLNNPSVEGADFFRDNVEIGSVDYTYDPVSFNTVHITDLSGGTWRVRQECFYNPPAAHCEIGVRRPDRENEYLVAHFPAAAATPSQVVVNGVATNYAYSLSGTTATMTVTDALNRQTVVTSDTVAGRLSSIAAPLNRTTLFEYDPAGRPTQITHPEGNIVNYTYDGRGNVTSIRLREKDDTGDTADDIVTSYSYDLVCSNPVTCNQPNSMTDALNHVTEYQYDPTHGGLTRVTLPAPSSGAVQPQTRYSYTLTNGEYLLTGISACQTQQGAVGANPATCANTADEVRTTLGYDAYGNVTSRTIADGSGTLSRSTAMTFDALGNVVTVDGPLSGTADTTRYRYNSGHLIGTVGPDPDGAGSLKHRAQRIIYADGLPSRVERGTVDSQSDSDWAAFTSLEAVETDYDANGRPTVSRLVSGSTTYALTQTSYDELGRVRCVAQRMSPSAFASPPAEVCETGAAGSYGPDRITRTSYDEAGRPILVETGVDTGDQAGAATTYTANDRVATVTDAEGNRTTYEYDVFDRLLNTRFPSPTTDGVSAPTSGTGNNFEQLGYDANGNITSRRLRDGVTLTFDYDALNRLTAFNRPSGERSQTFEYDNLGRVTDADQTNASIDYAWDALGRLTSHTDGGFGTTSFLYDAVGRRIRTTWPDSFYITYDYDVAGDLTAIKESGSTSLAAFTYDDRGRRTLLTRGNGTTTAYAYDNVSRLDQIVQNLDGSATANDVTLDFTRNPASQIVANQRSNNGYSFTGHANIHLAPSLDGLNRIVNTGFGYDAKGNLTTDPGGWAPGHAAGSYTYDSSNRLTSGAGQSFYYDPAGRLFAQANSGGYTYFLNSGDQIIGEYNSAGMLQRRYVHTPGIDEPLVWYEGSGTSARRYFHADERGSVIAISDNSGNLYSNINRYDEHGVPQGTLTGRFGYTGQISLPEVGLYHYRARAYNPSLGRFMQADPIGYRDGMNLYAYVGNDPTNKADPSGLQRVWRGTDQVYIGNREYINWGGAIWLSMPIQIPIINLNFSMPINNSGPVICRGMFRSGNRITLATPVEFYYGDYPYDPSRVYERASDAHANYWLDIFNNGRFNGRIGRYYMDVAMFRGLGGYTVYIGNPSLHAPGGEVASSHAMFVSYPTFGAADAIYGDHGLGHAIGNYLHSEQQPGYRRGQPGNIMDQNPMSARPQDPWESHVESGINLCNLQD